MLTDTQRRILNVLEQDERASVREIQAACGISSTSVVNYNLRRLAEAGKIILPPSGQARNIRVSREDTELRAYAEAWDYAAYLMGNSEAAA